MPRGNDAKEALHELADRFGEGVGNAELLIDANLAANTQALRRAELLPRDIDATAEARKRLDKLKGPNGEPAVSVAVRGAPDSTNRYTSIVVETEEGRHLIYALDDKDKPITPEDERGSGPEASEDESGSSSSSGRGSGSTRS